MYNLMHSKIAEKSIAFVWWSRLNVAIPQDIRKSQILAYSLTIAQKHKINHHFKKLIDSCQEINRTFAFPKHVGSIK